MTPTTIILFYKYTHVDDPTSWADAARNMAQQLHLKGRLLVAHEGVNGTFEGTPDEVEVFVKWMQEQPQFADVDFKRSEGTGDAFPKLAVKVRNEIVGWRLGEDDVNPQEMTGKYITAEELHEWIHSDKEFYIVDMRNDYEHAVGFFKNSVLPPLQNSRDLPSILPQLEHLRGKTIVTVCTGGVRCEKASGFLIKKGFADVYQLYNGIVTYMEKYPNEDFLGQLYVFDGRITMGFNVADPSHVVVGKCGWCGAATENYIDCAYLHCREKRHFLCCEPCVAKEGGFCTEICRGKHERGEVPGGQEDQEMRR